MNNRIKGRLRDLAFINAFISIVDDKCVAIENVSNIIECNEITVCIEASGYCIRIWGSGLTLSSYENNIIEVNGCISSIELEKQRSIAGK